MRLETLAKKESLDIENKIISQIRDIINSKNLEPGDKLPSERTLSDRLNVSRSCLRLAIQKLETYGLLYSIPQSGTFIANIGIVALNGMIDDILRLRDPNFKSLVETRILLELKTVSLAATKRTEVQLLKIKNSMLAFEKKVIKGENAVEEDLLFHLSIAEASGNIMINDFMLIIAPKILINFEKYHICDKNKFGLGIKEHYGIYNAIKEKKPKLAKQKMKEHFDELYKYCYQF